MGLDGTGDKDQTKFTVQTLTNLMAWQGITVNSSSVKVKNVAAVMVVTADLPPSPSPASGWIHRQLDRGRQVPGRGGRCS